MPVAEHRRGEVVERALEVGHGDALVDDEALDLVEHRAVRGVVLVGAEDPAGADDVDRRLAGQHRAGLHRRGVRAQHDGVVGRLGPEGVLHGARRVVGPEVERVEVEPLGLDDRALGDLPAHRHEDVGDPLRQRGDRVPGAGGARSQGSVTSTVSSTSIRSSCSASSSACRAASAWLTAPRAWPTRMPASLRACGGSAPISRLASASGERSPACSSADLLERRRGRSARGDRGERGVAHRVDLVGLQRGDLDGVVLGVGAGHGCLSAARPVDGPVCDVRATV